MLNALYRFTSTDIKLNMKAKNSWFLKILDETISTGLLPLRRIQEGKFFITGENMCTGTA